MKFTKVISVAAAAACVSAFAVNACAYTLDKDLRTGWSANITVPGEEFEGATPDSVFTLTFTADASLADMEGHNYWCVKPMINDTGWPFIANLVGPTLSEGGDTYALTADMTEIKFTIPAEELEHVQVAGMAFMGHGIKLNELTFSNDETLAAAPAAEPAAAEETAAPAAEETAAPATGDVQAATVSSKGSPDTGIADVAAVAGVAVIAGGALLISRKRK